MHIYNGSRYLDSIMPQLQGIMVQGSALNITSIKVVFRFLRANYTVAQVRPLNSYLAQELESAASSIAATFETSSMAAFAAATLAAPSPPLCQADVTTKVMRTPK